MSGVLAQAGLTMLLADAGDVVGVIFAFIVLPIAQAIVCWLTADALRQIPERCRLLEPELVWLLLIPIFNLYWNFRVFPAVAESFQLTFYSRGIADVEDCGERLARWYCGLSLCWVLPCINFFTGIAALVVIIMFLSEVDSLKRRLSATHLA